MNGIKSTVFAIMWGMTLGILLMAVSSFYDFAHTDKLADALAGTVFATLSISLFIMLFLSLIYIWFE